VYRGIWKTQNVAIKVFKGQTLDSKENDSFLKEIKFISKLKHRNSKIFNFFNLN
jgi:hypothetical protein